MLSIASAMGGAAGAATKNIALAMMIKQPFFYAHNSKNLVSVCALRTYIPYVF